MKYTPYEHMLFRQVNIVAKKKSGPTDTDALYCNYLTSLILQQKLYPPTPHLTAAMEANW